MTSEFKKNMEEFAFEQLKKEGKVEEVKAEEEKIEEEPISKPLTLEDYLPQLEELRREGLSSTFAGWELIKTGTFTGNINIADLDGNADRLWTLIIRARHTANFQLRIRFNGDAGANYSRYMHLIGRPAGTEVHQLDSAINDTEMDLNWPNTPNVLATIYIMAKSGVDRLINWNVSDYASNTTFSVIQGGGAWRNTAANITTINIITGTITEGEYWLFKPT